MESAFDRFWKLYPRKVSKRSAKKKWDRKKLDSHVDLILSDVRYHNEHDWKEIDHKYIPHPPTYLHNERWTDERPTDQARKGSTDWSRAQVPPVWDVAGLKVLGDRLGIHLESPYENVEYRQAIIDKLSGGK